MDMNRKYTGVLCGMLSAVLLLGSIPVSAEETIEGPLYENLNYEITDAGTVTITNCLQNAVTCTVPDTIEGKPVTAIAPSAFAECYFLEEAVIPDSVTSIGQQAFSACSALETITLPEHVESFGAGVFDSCTALKEVTIPGGIAELPQATFYECSGLEKVDLPEDIQVIGSEAFYNCAALTEIILPEHTNTISDYAFEGCASLTKLALPAGVENIGEYIFHGCSALTAIEVDPENAVFSDQDGVLFTKDGVTLLRYPQAAPWTEYRVPDGCTQLTNGSFLDAAGLTGIDLNQATVYGQDTFFRCTGLTEIVLPEGVTELAGYMFAYCSGLTSVTLPSTLKIVGLYSFYACGALEEVTVPEGTETIGAYSFFNCVGMKKLHLPDSITEVGDGAMGYYAETEDTEPQKIADFKVVYNRNQAIYDFVELYGLEGTGKGESRWWIWLIVLGGGALLIGGIVLIVILRRRAAIPKPVPGGRQGSAKKRPETNKKGKSK